MKRAPFDWTPERVELLRALYAEGLSLSVIGQRIGVSKSAVIGKAHRLYLPARPLPDSLERARRARHESAPPPLVAVAEGRREGCRFPLWGHYERPTHEYCGGRRKPGSSYCDGHHSVCFVKPGTPAHRKLTGFIDFQARKGRAA